MMDDLVRMLELSAQRFHCSQILLSLGLEAQGKSNPDLVRAMAGLAGGVGFCGEVCGALTGGACLLALYAGRGTPEEEEDPRLNLMINELFDWFSDQCTDRYGGIRCREILEENPANQFTRCPEIVGSIYDRVKELLVDNGFDLSEAR